MDDSQQPAPRPGFLRWMAICTGLLIMGGSGLCSAGFLVTMAADLFDGGSRNVFGDFGMILGMVAVWGGVPFLAGWGIWRAARKGVE